VKLRAAARADREIDAIVPRRAKALRHAASAIDLAHAEPTPLRFSSLTPAERKWIAIDMFEQTGLSKRAYWRESGHESWTHARSLVTPNTERVPTAHDLHVLEKLLFVLSVSPKPPRSDALRSVG
jgi:hypothetical protein